MALVLTILGLAVPPLAANPPEPTPLVPVSHSTAPSCELPIPPPHLANQLWPLPFGGRLSWATTAVANPDYRRAAARVFLLRGTGVVFSPEFGSLSSRLRRAGLWTEDLRAVGDRWVCERLIADHRAGRLGGPIVLVGHSRGGRHILAAARELEKAGITVDLLVCVDTALAPAVPGNVAKAVNVYLSGPRLYPASALVSAPGSRASIENVDLRDPRSPIGAHRLNHLTITADPAVQELVVERILEVVHDARAVGSNLN
jgi:hypothetical protein